jgi:hypothetical protein
MTYPLERYLNGRSAMGGTFRPDGRRLAFLTDITGTYHGCRSAEAEQIVTALRSRQVHVAYLRYEDKGHGLSLKQGLSAEA